MLYKTSVALEMLIRVSDEVKIEQFDPLEYAYRYQLTVKFQNGLSFQATGNDLEDLINECYTLNRHNLANAIGKLSGGE